MKLIFASILFTGLIFPCIAQNNDPRDAFIGDWEGTLFQEPNRKYFFTMLLGKDSNSTDGVLGVSAIKTTFTNENEITKEGDIGMMIVKGRVKRGVFNFEETDMLYQSVDSPGKYFWCMKKGVLSFSEERGKPTLKGKWKADESNCSPGSINLVKSEYIQFKTKKIPTYLNATLLEKVLEEMEISFEDRGFNKYKAMFNGYNVLINIDEGSMILRSYFNANVTLEQLNEYNQTYRWARTYIDRDGDLAFADELSFKGGISEANIKGKIEQFMTLLKEFSVFINN